MLLYPFTWLLLQHSMAAMVQYVHRRAKSSAEVQLQGLVHAVQVPKMQKLRYRKEPAEKHARPTHAQTLRQECIMKTWSPTMHHRHHMDADSSQVIVNQPRDPSFLDHHPVICLVPSFLNHHPVICLEMLELLSQLIDFRKGLLPLWRLCTPVQKPIGPVMPVEYALHGLCTGIQRQE